MKKLGVIGRIGPESTVIYYRGELSIIFHDETAAGVRVFDITRIHIEAAIEHLVS